MRKKVGEKRYEKKKGEKTTQHLTVGSTESLKIGRGIISRTGWCESVCVCVGGGLFVCCLEGYTPSLGL